MHIGSRRDGRIGILRTGEGKVTRLVEHTYYAVIRVRKEGELIELDSRPSDAIALSVHYDPALPIYVHEDVLEEVT